MPTEIRHLLFRAPEVVKALQSYHRRVGQPLNAGLVGQCVAAGDGFDIPVTFSFTVHADNGHGHASEVSIDSITLAAALIMHCRDNKIPLSAKSQKSLQRHGEQICLVATLGQG